LWAVAVWALASPGVAVDVRIAPRERAALVALYEATNGKHWHRADGWLGPVGSECRWWGVDCNLVIRGPETGRYAVFRLDLEANGLSGELPAALAELTHLVGLDVRDNDVGRVPEAVAARWDTGLLELWPASLLHGVAEISMETSSLPEGGCAGRRRATLRADGSVTDEGCGHVLNQLCIRREGQAGGFDLLARLVEKAGLPSFAEVPGSLPAAGPRTRISVEHKDGRREEVEYGELSLDQWALATTIRGILIRARWTKSSPWDCDANTRSR